MQTYRMNRRLVLENPERVADGQGGYTITWQTLGALWAQVTSRSGRETISTGAPVSSVSVQIIVRGAPQGAPERPRPEQRFREGQRLFIIRAVAETDPDGRFLTCFATEETVV